MISHTVVAGFFTHSLQILTRHRFTRRCSRSKSKQRKPPTEPPERPKNISRKGKNDECPAQSSCSFNPGLPQFCSSPQQTAIDTDLSITETPDACNTEITTSKPPEISSNHCSSPSNSTPSTYNLDESANEHSLDLSLSSTISLTNSSLNSSLGDSTISALSLALSPSSGVSTWHRNESSIWLEEDALESSMSSFSSLFSDLRQVSLIPVFDNKLLLSVSYQRSLPNFPAISLLDRWLKEPFYDNPDIPEEISETDKNFLNYVEKVAKSISLKPKI